MSATRRSFLAGLSAASYGRVLGANERVQLGVIGYGLIGAHHVHNFKLQPDAVIAGLCDVYQPRLEQGLAAAGPQAKGYSDFRRMLDNREVDAVIVATPDHWHALLTILSCAAGKDVYVEKPMTLFVREGRWMANAAARYKRIVQVGTQQRSGPHYQKARELVRSGYFGKVHSVRMGAFRNAMPGFGAPANSAPPAGFDYDMWLGPAPARTFHPHHGLYFFRFFWDYSGGQMTNLGAHEVDLAQWFMDVKGPSAVSSSGGRFCLQDDGETPDTQDALFEYPGFTALWSHREAGAGKRGGGTEFIGTKGSLSISRSGFSVTPDLKVDPVNLLPAFQGHPAGGPQRTDVKPQPWIQPVSGAGSEDEQFHLHARHFLDCVKSRRQPIAGVEDGHRVATACHLANISLRLGRKLRWDPEKEEIVGDREASEWLARPYRKPWDNVLRSFNL